jgi:alkaline phosphatase
LFAAIAAALTQCSAAQPQRADSELLLGETGLAAAVARLDLPDDAAVLIAAGDIARCDVPEPAQATAALVEAIVAAASSAIVVTAGDHAYPRGRREELERCYGPTWGRFESITRPSPGNHDYDTEDGAPFYEYFSFFDERPDLRGKGYYSFRFAGWHVVALNSLIAMDDGSPQGEWLEADLRANADASCTLAYWHHPRYSSGLRSLMPWYRGYKSAPLWETLLAHGADVVVSGHEHLYERFAPLDASGVRVANGLRQFTVGTAGGNLAERVVSRKHREMLYRSYGVLVFVLEPNAYRYSFVGVDGAVHDASDGAIPCYQ